MLKNKDEALNIISNTIWNSCTPYESAGWPPLMLDHIKCMMHNTAVAIVESIYTEQELDKKAEDILLDKPKQI
jgi:hypothetical protein